MSDCALPLIPDEFLCYFEILYFVFLYSSSPSGQNGKMLVKQHCELNTAVHVFNSTALHAPSGIFGVCFVCFVFFCFFICCPMSTVQCKLVLPVAICHWLSKLLSVLSHSWTQYKYKCTQMLTYMRLQWQVGLRTQTRIYAQIVAT